LRQRLGANSGGKSEALTSGWFRGVAICRLVALVAQKPYWFVARRNGIDSQGNRFTAGYESALFSADRRHVHRCDALKPMLSISRPGNRTRISHSFLAPAYLPLRQALMAQIMRNRLSTNVCPAQPSGGAFFMRTTDRITTEGRRLFSVEVRHAFGAAAATRLRA
jgi:hypothetical protein